MFVAGYPAPTPSEFVKEARLIMGGPKQEVVLLGWSDVGHGGV